MNRPPQAQYKRLWSDDRETQDAAFLDLLAATDKPVDWAYAVWDDLVDHLSHPDNRHRAIAAQLLYNLAKSDPDGRILKDFKALLAVTRDERFVTARRCLQPLWKIGAAGPKQRKKLIDGLTVRFADCAAEKNRSLIRHDILQGLRNLYDLAPDDRLKARALALIETEPDPKRRSPRGRALRPRGPNARVVQAGLVRAGDRVDVLCAPAA